MIYPNNFELKIGFSEIRRQLSAKCLCTLGKEKVEQMQMSTDAAQINEWMDQVREFRQMVEEHDDFPLGFMADVREPLMRIRPEGTHLEAEELYDLLRSLITINDIINFMSQTEYPSLIRMTQDVIPFPLVIQSLQKIFDKLGNIKDTASPELAAIRSELARTEGSVSRTLVSILRSAQSEGLVEKDATPTLRDGRLVLPVAPALKRRIKGIVHDESASGKTVFIEPSEVVEANNRIRELEAEERKEIIRILTEQTNIIRPHAKDMIESFALLSEVDFLQAKNKLAEDMNAVMPMVNDYPYIDWEQARHPLLEASLKAHDRRIVPLDIKLTGTDRIVLISGPNAGGKSVTLKTTGLLQYMLQNGLPIPVGEASYTGIFSNIMIDIGDEQSITDDLSTYSSHLQNMKMMIRHSDSETLLLIDEFGGGTEPQIGGAIAEATLKQFCKHKSYGIITTHYQNLKHFADEQNGVINGAMLYDRHEMRPLFELEIGRPGSSFAIEIARKIGMPEQVIKDASVIVGSEYIQSDKYLQDIVRDKRYWEQKRQNIHQKEKDIDRTMERYESDLAEIERQRKAIIAKARQQAEDLLAEANRRIENTIRQIKEAEAEKEATRLLREELQAFREVVAQPKADDRKAAQSGRGDIKSQLNEQMQALNSRLIDDAELEKKIQKIQERRQRHEQHKEQKLKTQQQAAEALRQVQLKSQQDDRPLEVGDSVRIKGTTAVGTIDSIQGKNVQVAFSGVKTRVNISKLERAKESAPAELTKSQQLMQRLGSQTSSQMTSNTVEQHTHNFQHQIDVRGLYGDDAVTQVMHFIDDAILIGVHDVRILHGKGNGILRQRIRQYLSSIPQIKRIRDEHVQFGGAGITVVELD